ncbi:MAG: class II aldolase/adducin family protein [Coriobacteriales bacterium]|jgi:L-fuculose-phosphate aldolase|nr:class II aldolase/adducin family protein [Coriobacteriales bacterium]
MEDFDFERFKKDLLDSVGNAADAVSTAARDTGNDVLRIKRFIETGRDLFLAGAVTSHGGNLSESDGSSIWITRTGSMLGHLGPNDIRKVGWEPSPADQQASMELLVHRAMYHALADRAALCGEPFGTHAVVHAHTRHTVFHSLITDVIAPLDSEGALTLGAGVTVLSCEATVASEEVAAAMASQVAAGSPLAVVRGHGPFALAESLEGALRLVSCLEYSAGLLTLFETTGRKGSAD